MSPACLRCKTPFLVNEQGKHLCEENVELVLSCLHGFCRKCLYNQYVDREFLCSRCSVSWKDTNIKELMVLVDQVRSLNKCFEYSERLLIPNWKSHALVEISKEANEILEAATEFCRDERNSNLILRPDRIKFDILCLAVSEQEDVPKIKELICEVFLRNHEIWNVDNDSYCHLISIALPVAQPKTLNIILTEDDFGESFLKLIDVVKKNFVGELRLILSQTYRNYTPCDDLIRQLEGARFHLTEFVGCVEDSDLLFILKPLLEKSDSNKPAKLEIAMRNPMKHRLYESLPTYNVSISLMMLHVIWGTWMEGRLEGNCPLPRNSPGLQAPALAIQRTEDSWIRNQFNSGVDDIVSQILYLAPANKTYSSIVLCRCKLQDNIEFQNMLRKLQRGGIRTYRDHRIKEAAVDVHSSRTTESEKRNSEILTGARRKVRSRGNSERKLERVSSGEDTDSQACSEILDKESRGSNWDRSDMEAITTAEDEHLLKVKLTDSDATHTDLSKSEKSGAVDTSESILGDVSDIDVVNIDSSENLNRIARGCEELSSSSEDDSSYFQETYWIETRLFNSDGVCKYCEIGESSGTELCVQIFLGNAPPKQPNRRRSLLKLKYDTIVRQQMAHKDLFLQHERELDKLLVHHHPHPLTHRIPRPIKSSSLRKQRDSAQNLRPKSPHTLEQLLETLYNEQHHSIQVVEQLENNLSAHSDYISTIQTIRAQVVEDGQQMEQKDSHIDPAEPCQPSDPPESFSSF